MSQCSKEIIRIREFLSELGFHMDEPTTLYGDNVAACTWANSISTHRKAKHIEVKYHFIRSKIQDGQIETIHVASNLNRADGLTKPLDKNNFINFRNSVDVLHYTSVKHKEGC